MKNSNRCYYNHLDWMALRISKKYNNKKKENIRRKKKKKYKLFIAHQSSSIVTIASARAG